MSFAYESMRIGARSKSSAIESARPRPEAAEAGGRQAGRGRQGSRGRGAEAEAGRREEAKEAPRRHRGQGGPPPFAYTQGTPKA